MTGREYLNEALLRLRDFEKYSQTHRIPNELIPQYLSDTSLKSKISLIENNLSLERINLSLAAESFCALRELYTSLAEGNFILDKNDLFDTVGLLHELTALYEAVLRLIS